MAQEYRGECTLGIDYGKNSCRAAVIDAYYGAEIASAVVEYPGWGQELFCNSTRNVFSHHPLDYIESLRKAVGEERLVSGMLIKATVYPRPAFHNKYATLYSRYKSLGICAEKEFS